MLKVIATRGPSWDSNPVCLVPTWHYYGSVFYLKIFAHTAPYSSSAFPPFFRITPIPREQGIHLLHDDSPDPPHWNQPPFLHSQCFASFSHSTFHTLPLILAIYKVFIKCANHLPSQAVVIFRRRLDFAHLFKCPVECLTQSR